MQAPPGAGSFKVVYADPPWRFATYSARGKGRSPEAHYDCLSLEALKAMPVAEWTARDAVLFLWATDPLLDRAFEVIRAWGFAYKTVGFVWTKLNKSAPEDGFREEDFFTGMGFWTRANAELCLLATRGRPKRLSGAVRRLVIARRREHSRKPDCVHDRIEQLCPGPYLELFARSSRPGWTAWGLEQALFDDGRIDTRRLPSSLKDATAEELARYFPSGE